MITNITILKKNKNILVYLTIVFASFVAFDIVCHIMGIKHKYFPSHLGRAMYPDGYFKEDPVMGFDIKPSQQPTTFQWGRGNQKKENGLIFSNRYGCFDKNETYQNPVIYLAGDSVTWGYANYDKKFGYLIEQELQINVAKCGVSNTGIKHSLLKLKKWIQKTGKVPKIILLTVSYNDEQDVLLFPKASVIDNYFVDVAYFQNNEVIRRTPNEIKKLLKKHLAKRNSKHLFSDKIFIFLEKYSISYKMSKRLARSIIPRSNSNKKIAHSSQGYSTTLDEKLWQAYTQAVNEWIAYTNKMNITTIFLGPYGRHNHRRYQRLISYLTSRSQHIIDFPKYLKKNELSFNDLVWPTDDHPSEYGNNVIARAYVQYMKEHRILDALTVAQ